MIWKNLVTTAPADVEAGDAFAVKLVAVVDPNPDVNLWSAYRGPSGWADEKVAANGDRVREELAWAAFPVLARRDDLDYYC